MQCFTFLLCVIQIKPYTSQLFLVSLKLYMVTELTRKKLSGIYFYNFLDKSSLVVLLFLRDKGNNSGTML